MAFGIAFFVILGIGTAIGFFVSMVSNWDRYNPRWWITVLLLLLCAASWGFVALFASID